VVDRIEGVASGPRRIAVAPQLERDPVPRVPFER